MTLRLPPIERIDVSAYRVPTDAPESDGTATWDHTGVVVVHAHAGGAVGTGWSYGIRPVKAICKIGLTVVTIVGHEQELRSGSEEASA
jgi:hypothetical protein